MTQSEPPFSNTMASRPTLGHLTSYSLNVRDLAMLLRRGVVGPTGWRCDRRGPSSSRSSRRATSATRPAPASRSSSPSGSPRNRRARSPARCRPCSASRCGCRRTARRTRSCLPSAANVAYPAVGRLQHLLEAAARRHAEEAVVALDRRGAARAQQDVLAVGIPLRHEIDVGMPGETLRLTALDRHDEGVHVAVVLGGERDLPCRPARAWGSARCPRAS